MTHTIIRALVLAAAAACLTGCDTLALKGALANRLVTTLQGDEAWVLSTYGPFVSPLSPKLSAEDAAELKRMREAARKAEAPK